MSARPLAAIGLFFFVVTASSQPARAGTLKSREVKVDPAAPFLPPDGNLLEKEVALTFDDGPDPGTTPRILETLEKFAVKAIFFQVGVNVEAHPELSREIIRRGHALGSHTWDHPDLATLPLREAIANIERGHAAVERATGPGGRTPFFRFPRFSSTERLLLEIRKLGLTPFFANIITQDWKTPDPKALLVKALAALDAEKRGIVLFHDIQPQTAVMLGEFLSELSARGYTTAVFRAEQSQR